MRSLLLFSSLCAVALGGCAFDEGQPWGIAEVSLALSFDPPAGRLDDEGRIKTSNDYRIALSRLEVAVGPVTLQISEGGGPLAFDPANPPPGYTLCHNGHCHAADGSLPTYAEIEAEILGVSSSATEVVATMPEGRIDLLGGATVTLAMRDCPERCVLPQGTLSNARLVLSEVWVEGTVYDGTTRERVPVEGVPFAEDLLVDVPLTLSVGAAIAPGEEVGVRLEIDMDVAAGLLDGIAWDTSSPSDATEIIQENLREQSELRVDVKRFNP